MNRLFFTNQSKYYNTNSDEKEKKILLDNYNKNDNINDYNGNDNANDYKKKKILSLNKSEMNINNKMIYSYVYHHTIHDRFYYFNNKIKPSLPKQKIENDNYTKYILNFHGGKNNNNDTFRIPKNFFIISLEKKGLMMNSIIIEFLLFKMGLLNNFSDIFFKQMSEDMLYSEYFLSSNITNFEEKYFKVYNNTNFYDFELETDRSNNFYTGLFKCPIKPVCIIDDRKLDTDDIIELFNNNDIQINSYETRCVINPFKFSNVKLFFKSEYYTLHSSYLKKLKKNLKSDGTISKKIKMKCFSNDIITIENRIKKIRLSKIVKFLCDKRKKTKLKKPIILLLAACTKLDIKEYYQDNLFGNSTYFNHYDKIKNNKNENENNNYDPYNSNKGHFSNKF